MKLATIRTPLGNRVVRVDTQIATEVGYDSLEVLLAESGWRATASNASGQQHELAGLDYAPLVSRPEKVICVGLNYRTHILEMGRELPEHPTLFSKFHRALIGANDPVVLPSDSRLMDWEAELGVVIGSAVRHATPTQARDAIAGYTVVNDVTARDLQFRTLQWLQGKTVEATTPIGPWLVTDMAEPSLELACVVDGEVKQQANTKDLVFSPADLVEYISKIITLVPGDVIATGTPGGVGHARKPPEYLGEGSVLETTIDGIGVCRNVCKIEA